MFVVLVLSAGWGFLFNDFFDRESDAKEGRADAVHGHGLRRLTMALLILLTAGASWAIVFAIPGEIVSKGVLGINYLVAILYSAPPARLKVRKFWGFLANSLMERPLPIVVLLTFMNYYTAMTIVLPALMELTWSVFKHQAADMVDDIKAGVTTFAVSLGQERSYLIVNRFLNPASVLSLVVLLTIAYSGIPRMGPLIGAGLVAVVVLIAAAVALESRGSLNIKATPTDPPYIIVLNLSYRFIVLPILGYEMLVLAPQYYLLLALLVVSLAYQAYASYALGRSFLRK